MAFQVHLGLEHHKLFFQAFWVETKEMVFLEVVLEGLVVDVVLLLAVRGATVTNMAAFMLVTTVRIKFIITIETLATKATFRMSSETALVDGTWLVVADLFMLSQLGVGK